MDKLLCPSCIFVSYPLLQVDLAPCFLFVCFSHPSVPFLHSNRPGAIHQNASRMRTTVSISRLCLYLYISLSGLQLLLAHDVKGQVMDNVKDNRMGLSVGKGNCQMKAYEMSRPAAQAAQNGKKAPMAMAQEKANEQAKDDGGAMNEIVQKNSEQDLFQAQNQTVSQMDGRARTQAQNDEAQMKDQDKNLMVVDAEEQMINQGKDQDMPNAQAKVKSACDPQAASSSQGQGQKSKDRRKIPCEDQAVNQGRSGQDTAQDKESQNKGPDKVVLEVLQGSDTQ